MQRGEAMHRNFLLPTILIVMIAPSTEAAPIPIVDFYHRNVMSLSGPSPPPATISFDFEAGTSLMGEFLSWEDDYGPSDVGMTFVAPQAVVDDANLSLVLPNVKFHLRSGPVSFSNSIVINSPICGFGCELFVPDFTRYKVTSVERVIEQLEFIDQPQAGTYIYKAGQRIRYLGEPIPPVPGDFNTNGYVDATDYVFWRNRNGMDGSLPNESGVTPFDITQEDYDFWRANFGRTAFAETGTFRSSSIPEPTAFLHLVLWFLCVFVIGRPCNRSYG
jgi:hypothetical protein